MRINIYKSVRLDRGDRSNPSGYSPVDSLEADSRRERARREEILALSRREHGPTWEG